RPRVRSRATPCASASRNSSTSHERARMRLGVVGGTFDPMHNGHIAAAEAAIDCAHLDEVVFVPTGTPPHRPPTVATAEQRLEMCRLATADDPRFSVSDIEVARGGPSYTVDTLLSLRGANPHAELFLVLGWDAAALFRSWHRPQEVIALAPIVVVTRPGRRPPKPQDLTAAGRARGRVRKIHPGRLRERDPRSGSRRPQHLGARSASGRAVHRLSAAVPGIIGGDLARARAGLTSLQLARLLKKAAADRKAWDAVVIDVREKTTLADYFVVC